MASEWWTNPSEASRRLELLTRQINTLRNAAMGRGVKPLVSDDLADYIAAEQAAYQDWRSQLPSGWMYGAVSWADELEEWTARANLMRDRIAGELGAGDVPSALTQWSPSLTPGDLANAGKVVVIAESLRGLGGLALALATVYLLSRRSRG